MDQTTNSDYIRFDRQLHCESSEGGLGQPTDPPDSQGGGGMGSDSTTAELPGVIQQTPSPPDVSPGGDRPKGGGSSS